MFSVLSQINLVNTLPCPFNIILHLLKVLASCLCAAGSPAPLTHARLSYLPTYLLTYLLTYSMVQSPSWEANWFAAGQEIPRILWNPKVHCCIHKRPPPVPILVQPNPVHIPTSNLLEIHLNIIHPSTPRSPQWSLSLRFPHQDPICPPLLTHTRHMPSPSHSSRFYYPHNIGWAVQIIKLLVMQSPPFPRYLVPPEVQIFSSTPYSQTPSASFPPSMSVTKFHTHTKQQAKL